MLATVTTLIMKSKEAAQKNQNLKESLGAEGPLPRKALNKQYSQEILGELLLHQGKISFKIFLTKIKPLSSSDTKINDSNNFILNKEQSKNIQKK